MRPFLPYAFAMTLSATSATGQEFIVVPDLISDEAFYRLVACAAPPRGACGKPFIRWSEERRLNLRVGIADIAASFPGYKLDLIDRAIDDAIAEINASGAELYLERAFEGPLDVPIYLVSAEQGGEVSDTGVGISARCLANCPQSV